LQSDRHDATIIVLAKAPVAGSVKTRLSPPCTPQQAADIASAALADTFDAVLSLDARHRVLVLDGDPMLVDRSDAFTVLPQCSGGLGERLDAAFRNVFDLHPEGAAVLIAMDTPHVDVEVLRDAFDALTTHDAVLGMADDGGYWLIGFRSLVRHAFDSVPMSVATTGVEQEKRLRHLGCSVALAPSLFDIDTASDLDRLATLHPELRTSQTWQAFQLDST
jgi:uncharacterized protein